MENELYHHGILGQKWGVRRYQNYDGTRTSQGRTRYKNTKYTNIDGSINEKGKVLVSNFASKEKTKNDKYYAKYIARYQKRADKAETEEEKEKYLNMMESAEATRKSVNESIDNMSINEVLAISIDREAKVKRGVATAVGSVAGVALPFLAVKGAGAAANYLNEIDPMTGLSKLEEFANSPTGIKAGQYAEAAIRGYSDMNAYVFSVYADQALQRIGKSGLPQQLGSTIGSAVGTAVGTAVDTAASKTYNTAASFESLAVQAVLDAQRLMR